MKVFAHYECNENIEYRWRALLQFGSSWDVLGSVVMKNPGSAHRTNSNQIKDGSDYKELIKFDKKNEWYEFSPDSTMHCIGRLFNEYCRQQSKDFEGVIQVFNLMNIRDPNLANAIDKSTKARYDKLFTTEEDIKNLISPIYIGWGQLGQSPLFKDSAIRLFNATLIKEGSKYLDEEFQKNSFYHPLYLMGRGKHAPKSIYLLNAFCQNTQNPKCDIQAIPTYTFSAQNVFKGVAELLEQYFEVIEKKNNVWRFVLHGDYSISVTQSSNESGHGYLGIRHFSNHNDEKSDNIVLNLLNSLGFTNASNSWLGTKSFKRYGYDNETIIAAILKECNELKTKLITLLNKDA